MKNLSDILMMLALAIVLGVAPLQDISASVSECMNDSQTMYQQVNASDKVSHENMNHPDLQNDCCQESSCEVSHCATTTAATITSDTMNEMVYTVSNIVLKPNVSLIQFYPSSLYRPPKI